MTDVGRVTDLLMTSLFMDGRGVLPAYLSLQPIEVFTREVALMVLHGSPVHAGRLIHLRIGTHPALCGLNGSMVAVTSFLRDAPAADVGSETKLLCAKATGLLEQHHLAAPVSH